MLKPRAKIRVPRRGMIGSAAGEETFDAIWSKLAAALREIHTHNASKLSFEELYRAAYKLVLKKQGEQLHDNVCALEATYLTDVALKTLQDSVSPVLLTSDGQDRALTTDNKRRPIYTSGLNVFRDKILRKPCKPDHEATISQILLQTVLFLIHMERQGHPVDRLSLHHVITMLWRLCDTDDEVDAMRLYLTLFEPQFLEESRDFYTDEGTALLQAADAVSFCRNAHKRLDEERRRCEIALLPTTTPKVQKIIDEHLIAPHMPSVITLEGSGVKHMLDNERLDDLHGLYQLVARIDDQKRDLRKALSERVLEQGNQINAAAQAAAKPMPRRQGEAQGGSGGKTPSEKGPNLNAQTVAAIDWVNEILRLKAKYDDVWKRAFDEDHAVQTTLTDSFRDFINMNERAPEYVSLFLDENLKKGIKGKTEEEVEELLDRGITLLRFVTDRDVFEQYYKKHLSRRLLLRRSISSDAEKLIISKMKVEVGTQFTSKLEAMFTDMVTSADITAAYKEYVADGRGLTATGDKPIELDINVLTSTRWPIEMIGRQDSEESPIKYPDAIEQVRASFEQFYHSRHSGRKLSWQLSMGTADIRAVFPRPNGKLARHELNVSTYAAFILLLFNDVPASQALTLEEIQARTGIPDSELKRNLQSLAVAPKTRVLRKEPMSKDIHPGDRFYYNDRFQSQFTKIKIGVVSQAANRVESQKQRSETEAKTGAERKITIEAAIVRIMKQRKQLMHTQLMTEVIQQLSSRFVPDVAMLKGRIEDLIEREYIERVPDSEHPAYAYVA
ncbi:Cullin-3 [Ascosphaera acerosa]|nr:Cullin-3 [Ascosphaera acerosa]